MTRRFFTSAELVNKYDYVGEFHENKAVVQKDNKYGFVKRVSTDQYEEFVKPIYVEAYEYIGGYAQVVNDVMKHIFLNNKGEECFNEELEDKYSYEGAKI